MSMEVDRARLRRRRVMERDGATIMS